MVQPSLRLAGGTVRVPPLRSDHPPAGVGSGEDISPLPTSLAKNTGITVFAKLVLQGLRHLFAKEHFSLGKDVAL